MANVGQSIANPVTGERVVFCSTAADSGGELVSMDYYAPAGYVIAPTHVHPRQRGMPAPLQMAVLMRDHLDETCAPVIPMVAQRALVGGLAAIGRRRGYRSE